MEWKMNMFNINHKVTMNNQPASAVPHVQPTQPRDTAKIGQSAHLSRLIVIWLAGITVFLPVKIINLPSNFELVDIWILMGWPVLLAIYSMGRHRIINLTYAIPMWLVMVSSLLSTFASPVASNSLVVILKEVYLFTWFITVTVFLSVLNARDLRRVLYVWSIVAVMHGLLIIAQFFSPEIWRFTNALGGNSVEYQIYRPAGLFICDHAGCANKAAFFQLLGFVPLLLTGFPKKTTLLFGILLLASMLATGSMGATLALTIGTLTAMLVIAAFKKNLFVIIKYFLRFVFASLLLAGVFYVIISQSPTYSDHFERIILGRFDKSSGSRFNLWQRGIGVLLEHNSLLWGVGPENFRVLDPAQTDNQLHNDTLAFLVERGLIGLSGLALFAGIGLRRAVSILQISYKTPNRARLELVVFLAVIIAVMIESLTHQIFRTREMWLVLAVQEAVYFWMITSQNVEFTSSAMNKPIRYRHALLARPKAAVDD
jgi:O-antigen ligase